MTISIQPGSRTTRAVIETRSYERLLVGVHTGAVRLDTRDWRYRHTVNGTDMDDVMFDAEDRGWVHLAPGQPPQVTAAGMQWLADRYARYGTAPTRPDFMQSVLPPPSPVLPSRTWAGRPGERNPAARLTETQVRDIRARLAAGAGRNRLAAEYRVDRRTITDIKTGTTWRHVA